MNDIIAIDAEKAKLPPAGAGGSEGLRKERYDG
jgi:hypothetical protein